MNDIVHFIYLKEEWKDVEEHFCWCADLNSDHQVYLHYSQSRWSKIDIFVSEYSLYASFTPPKKILCGIGEFNPSSVVQVGQGNRGTGEGRNENKSELSR